MKKLTLLACGLCIASMALAQESVLKDANRMLKVEVPDHAKIATMLKGAMTDPTTKDNVLTWYLAGKNGIQTWTTGFEQYMQGAQPDKTYMSRSLLEGYGYFLKALPMDTIIDPKGKVKTKYSKEIIKTIASNHTSFKDAGVFLYEAGDLAGAYEAWAIYQELPTMAILGAQAPKADPDSLQAETYYNMGIFAYQSDMKPEAMESFLKAGRLGQGETAYENALAMANDLGDKEAIETIAMEGFNKYGKSTYIGALINVYIKEKDYARAEEMINKAIEANPDNAVLYNVKGVLVENNVNEEGVSPEAAKEYNARATELYKKAVELDPQNAEAQFNYGRMLANTAYAISDSDEASNMDAKTYNELVKTTIEPLWKQGAEHLEKAIAIDREANRQAFSILKNIYYNLKDDANMQRIADLELE